MSETSIASGDRELTESIIQCIINVHRTLGPGFLETVYRRALLIELRKANLSTETEKEVIIHYAEEEVGIHRLDLVVENKVVLELKTVEWLDAAHYGQLRFVLESDRAKGRASGEFRHGKSRFSEDRLTLMSTSTSPFIPTSPALY